jgi:asparagine synthase (glutamine-hydrolysing)
MASMGAVMRHRGPDDDGCYVGPGIALGMRRLSIIDLAGGHQPIANEDETLWVVCNGEIYNFLELRQELQKKGHRFRTNSDTEVLVHLYEEEGLEFLRRLRGMFAIALWDTSLSRLILARDRVGKKPLYIQRSPARLLFASEIKSILEVSEVPREVDLHALQEYLALGYVPGPRTLFKGIYKVLPGHFLVIDKNQVQDRAYWDVDFDHLEHRSDQQWEELVREKLLESVRIRLVSDVPLGAFLSGGIDSSSVVAAMSQCSDQPVKTYSIGFAGPDQFYNELPYARTVAEAFHTDHHEIIVRPDVAELLPRLIWHMDEPIADSAFITTYLVARLARESVTVILSGVGGDELFGGYRRYLGERLGRYYRLLPGPVRKHLLPRLFALLPQDRHSSWQNSIRYARAFVDAAELPPAQRYLSYITVFSPEVRDRLLCNGHHDGDGAADPGLHRLIECLEHNSGADTLGRIIYTDIKTSLADDLLALTDKMTMAASIECRAPFMDQELVELTASMPSHLKVHGLEMKYLLKRAVRPWLPKQILDRKKRGFGAPIGAWLRHDLEALVRDTLSPESVKRRGFFDWRVVKEVIAAHDARRRDHTDNLLALISFEVWCRIFLDGSDWQSSLGAHAAHAANS